MKKLLLFSLILSFALAAFPVAARPGTTEVQNAAGKTFSIPSHAVEISPGVYSLGTQRDPQTGKKVEGIAIIHYKKGYHHRPGHAGGPGGGGTGDTASTCYAVLSKGAAWRNAEPWVMNTSNGAGLNEGDIFALEQEAIGAWETAADAEIFGNGSQTNEDLSVDAGTLNKDNEVYFADVDSPGAIAVTVVWGYFSGPPFAREIVEWDQIYDDVDFEWSAIMEQDPIGVQGKMDFLNIATHEVGHATGLGHPSDSCAEETMYRFANTAETKKRTLEPGDVAGINSLY